MNTYKTAEVAAMIGIHPNTVRLALQIEILQNGLRRKIIHMVKISAQGDFDKVLELTKEYLAQVKQEQDSAKGAIHIVKHILEGASEENMRCLKRREVSRYLQVSMDSLRNWEMNGLLEIKRKANGYRVYIDEDIRRLKIIRSLRCANF